MKATKMKTTKMKKDQIDKLPVARGANDEL
jgi:hypothetical protein